MIKLNKRGRTVRVPTSTINQWRLKFRHGDISTIATESGLSRSTIVKAFNGNAQQDLITYINNYYEPINA
jgi:hypothetical protein